MNAIALLLPSLPRCRAIPGARALIRATDTRGNPRVWSLQELHKELHG